MRLSLQICWMLIGLVFSGWLGGMIVVASNENVSVFAALQEPNPYRGALSTGLQALIWGWPIYWASKRKGFLSLKGFSLPKWSLWALVIGVPVMVCSAQTYFFLWPHEWHGRAESYKTVAIFLKSFWGYMVPLSLVCLGAIAYTVRQASSFGAKASP
jgi:hypothetical protein